jgi:hypothetical protein
MHRRSKCVHLGEAAQRLVYLGISVAGPENKRGRCGSRPRHSLAEPPSRVGGSLTPHA